MSVSKIERFGMLVTERFIVKNQNFSDNNIFEFHTEEMHQKLYGDYTVLRNNIDVFIELKTEERYTGNIFLETWSNLCFENDDYYRNHGCNAGWLKTSRADYLFYYFIDRDSLFIFDLRGIQKHIFGYFKDNEWIKPFLSNYQEKSQKKNAQKNHTRGLIAPISTLKAHGVECVEIENAQKRYAPEIQSYECNSQLLRNNAVKDTNPGNGKRETQEPSRNNWQSVAAGKSNVPPLS